MTSVHSDNEILQTAPLSSSQAYQTANDSITH